MRTPARRLRDYYDSLWTAYPEVMNLLSDEIGVMPEPPEGLTDDAADRYILRLTQTVATVDKILGR